MGEVGIRELRDNLSRYIGRVAQGEEVTVTDHGKAVARIVPHGLPRLLDRLVADGLVTPAHEARRTRPARIHAGEAVSGLVDDQRR